MPPSIRTQVRSRRSSSPRMSRTQTKGPLVQNSIFQCKYVPPGCRIFSYDQACLLMCSCGSLGEGSRCINISPHHTTPHLQAVCNADYERPIFLRCSTFRSTYTCLEHTLTLFLEFTLTIDSLGHSSSNAQYRSSMP